ncbi:MAG: alpha/beta hydrolase [Porticoccaceae bacterium]
MVSKEAQKIVDLYHDWKDKLALNGEMELDELRVLFDGWGDLTGETTGVNYETARIADVDVVWAKPAGADKTRVLLCCHGGGFVVGSSKSHRKMFGHIAKAVGCYAVILDYTRAPENPHPGIVNQAVAVYKKLLDDGYKPHHIATTGDSAGGNLCTTVVLRARELKLPLPAAFVPISPWYDMEGKGASMITNADNDALVAPSLLEGMTAAFLGGKSPVDPLANPLHADLKGLPPALIQVGGYECLLDDSRTLAKLMKDAGGDVELQVFLEMQHVFHFMAGKAPEADDAVAKMAKFLKPKLGLV